MPVFNWTIMDAYYFINAFWIQTNVILIIPFLISCIFRIINQSIGKYLWTDHFARFFLTISCIFYIFDMIIKYKVDGTDTIC